MTKKTFKEFYSNTQGKDLDELRVMSRIQRRKLARRMKKLAKSATFKMKVARSKLRILPPEKLLVKAKKLAKKKVLDRFYPNYKDMSIARKVSIDQILASKYGGLIAKLSKRLLVPLRKMEKEKVKRARLAKQAKK